MIIVDSLDDDFGEEDNEQEVKDYRYSSTHDQASNADEREALSGGAVDKGMTTRPVHTALAAGGVNVRPGETSEPPCFAHST